MSVAETLDLLTPGTVWLRRDGSQAKFLFVTNTALSPKTQLAHPPQVIYSDSKGNIFNRDIDDFFRVYTMPNLKRKSKTCSSSTKRIMKTSMIRQMKWTKNRWHLLTRT
jgi:hypothetical protein